MGKRKSDLSRSTRSARLKALQRARKAAERLSMAKKSISIEVEPSQDCQARQSEFTYYKERKCGKTRKKWTNEENQLLLNYLLENNDFEKATARLYYANCLNKTKIDATPKMMRGKVRHLKKTYLMAEQWLRAKVNQVDIDCPIIKEKLHKICPYYNRLSQIFPINNSDTAVSAKIFDDFTESNSWLPEERCSWSEDLMQMVKSEIIVDEAEIIFDEEAATVIKSEIIVDEAANLVKPEIIFDEEAATVIKSEIIVDEAEIIYDEEAATVIKSEIIADEEAGAKNAHWLAP